LLSSNPGSFSDRNSLETVEELVPATSEPVFIFLLGSGLAANLSYFETLVGRGSRRHLSDWFRPSKRAHSDSHAFSQTLIIFSAGRGLRKYIIGLLGFPKLLGVLLAALIGM
jgi:hypothetical protein